MGQRIEQHVAAFNQAVESGDWTGFGERFAPDARMSFVNAPAGPFEGRAAIVAAYQANPPTDTMSLLSSTTEPDGTDVARFQWSTGGAGTMRVRWTTEARISGLEISFG
ncbi:nuclear transport factor 2 family protein [Kribbella deserti]|uniref:Nuclear transport factor 2 family protein n=1 Tax=Kribbella deserti TaxID=1926257 RepID=A0ABV6QXU4_9ACTN